MTVLSRRAFFGWLAAAVPATAFVRRAHAAAVGELAADRRTLRAVAEVVLPTALGSPGITAAADRFQRWIAGYREGAEHVHGYGTSALSYAGPTPATRWAEQLDKLDTSARTSFGKAFADLPLAERTAMVRGELDALKADRIPSLGRASHVALALLAHFYASPEATDMCYNAKIGRQMCRPLAAASRKPLPLAKART